MLFEGRYFRAKRECCLGVRVSREARMLVEEGGSFRAKREARMPLEGGFFRAKRECSLSGLNFYHDVT